MASENAVVQKLQWYQSITFITVTFSLDEQYRKKVVAQFEKDCCKLLVEGEQIIMHTRGAALIIAHPIIDRPAAASLAD